MQNISRKFFVPVYFWDKVGGPYVNKIAGSKRDQKIYPVAEREQVGNQTSQKKC